MYEILQGNSGWAIVSGGVCAVETSVAMDGVLATVSGADPRLRSVARDCCLWSPPGAFRQCSLSSHNLYILISVCPVRSNSPRGRAFQSIVSIEHSRHLKQNSVGALAVAKNFHSSARILTKYQKGDIRMSSDVQSETSIGGQNAVDQGVFLYPSL